MKPKRSRIDKAVARIWGNLASRVRRLGHKMPDKLAMQHEITRVLRGRYTCGWCGETLTPSTLSVDHAIPASRGGNSGIRNLMLVHKLDNRRKGELTIGEYRGLLNLIEGWPDAARLYVLRKLSSAPSFYGRGR